MTINSNRDLEIAYNLIKWSEEFMATHAVDNPDRANQHLIELKRSVREYTHRPADRVERYIDRGFDSYIALYPLPENLRTLAEAEEYFEEWERIERPYSAYDCTGKAFTSWHKIFPRRGRFYVYHSIAFDV